MAPFKTSDDLVDGLQPRILDGLPAYGPPAIGFSSSGRGLHSEGLVVAFEGSGHNPWVGNFMRGMTKFDYVVEHPNKHHTIVIAGGEGYVVDPVSADLFSILGAAITGLVNHPMGDRLVFNFQDISFGALGRDGWVWKSRRVSWDGLRSLHVSENNLEGEAWRYDNAWISFNLNLETGAVSGGSYSEPNP